MKIENAFELFQAELSGIYDDSEATSVTRIVFEDVFQLHRRMGENLQASELEDMNRILDRLQKGEPVQYILGEADFWGLRIMVNPHVLIPRMDSETLVDEALVWLREAGIEQPRVLDIGTGSGCLALAIKHGYENALVQALDIDPEALQLAGLNASRLNLEIELQQANILNEEQWPEESFDLIVSNPPYIPPSEKNKMPDRVLHHEPELALFVPEEDPMLFYNSIADFARKTLRAEGAVLVEINEFRANEVVEVFRNAGYSQIKVIQDLGGADRVVLAR